MNNFLDRALTYNPNGCLTGARHATVVGHYLYVSADAGLVVLDIDDPLKPRVCAVIGSPFLNKPRMAAVQFRYCYVVDDEGVKVLDVTDLQAPTPKSLIRLPEARSIYLARTYAYVAAGPRGLVIFDITKADEPRLDQIYDAGGVINDAHDVKLGVTYNSVFAYVADGHNGLRIVQLTSPETPGYDGFSPRPTPCLIATFKPKEGKILSVARGLDRDRAVDESGNQLAVFGRLGARPLNELEQKKMYLRQGRPWFVSDDPHDSLFIERRRAPIIPLEP